jgi:uncharacterized membrane protein required for colicin V production
MNLGNIPIHWFDFAALIILLLGLSKGRKNGMTIELLPMLQWLAIIFAGAFLYHPLGDMLCHSSPGLSRLFAYISMYVAVAIMVKIAFSMLHKAIAYKLTGSNIFGRAEYYLGMIGGGVRFACVLVAALALLNARYYSSQELASAKAYQVDMYGSTFFPGLGATQQEVFKGSLLGSAFRHYAGFMLISTGHEENEGVHKRKVQLQ